MYEPLVVIYASKAVPNTLTWVVSFGLFPFFLLFMCLSVCHTTMLVCVCLYISVCMCVCVFQMVRIAHMMNDETNDTGSPLDASLSKKETQDRPVLLFHPYNWPDMCMKHWLERREKEEEKKSKANETNVNGMKWKRQTDRQRVKENSREREREMDTPCSCCSCNTHILLKAPVEKFCVLRMKTFLTFVQMLFTLLQCTSERKRERERENFEKKAKKEVEERRNLRPVHY